MQAKLVLNPNSGCVGNLRDHFDNLKINEIQQLKNNYRGQEFRSLSFRTEVPGTQKANNTKIRGIITLAKK